MSIRLLTALVVVGVGVAVVWGLSNRPAPPAAARPNVLIVLWDTVRADRMSLYGHDRPTTPRLDAFAAEATVYENATAPGMWTLPTHATMFTGRYPTTHGARAGYRWLDDHHDTLAELLGASGYDSFLFSSNLVAGPMTNLHQGFDTVHTTYPRTKRRPGRYAQLAAQATRDKIVERDASNEIAPAFAGRRDDHWPKAAYKDAAPVIVQGLLDWLAARTAPEKPWFAYLNLMEAHTPRVPSMEARRKLLGEAEIELGLATDVSLFAENEFMIGQRTYTEVELEAIRGVYDATLIDLDTATATLFDALRSLGTLDDTVVIVVSDHGEHLGEHRRLEHRWSIRQPLLHVPLLIRYPDRFSARRVADRVSTADLFSTILELAGVPEPEGTQTRSLLAEPPEHVFTQLLDPFASQLQNVREAYSDVDIDYEPLLRTYCAAFEGDHKYVHASNGEHALYDVGTDPAEQEDRLEQQPEQAQRLADALYRWEHTLPPYDPSLRAPVDVRSKAQRQERVEERQLAAMLGYVVDDEGSDDVHVVRCGPLEAP